ncbi:MAG: hypothetical protein Q7R40_05115 [Phaeospirillum sp.]|nr:hypothetical protein [Phaeospirillum sp.]
MAAVAMLAACTHVNDEALARLRSGKTTVTEAIEALGRPDRDETLADGSRMLTYVTTQAHTRPANMVPGLTYVWGGWDVTADEAGLMFAPDGVLRFYAWSSSRQTPIKVVGRDIVAPKPPEPATTKQDPPPVSGKGASLPDHHSAD